MKLKFWLQTNKVGSRAETTVEVDGEEGAELDQAGKDDYAKEMFLDIALARLGDWDYEEAS